MFRNSVLSIVSILACMGLIACMGDSKEPMIHEGGSLYHGEGFSVVIPIDIEVAHKNPVEDFLIYSFQSGGDESILLHAYVGNHPQREVLKAESSKMREYSLSGYTVQRVDYQDRKGKFYTNVFIRLLEEGFPEFVHFWYEGLSKNERDLAEQIIASIRTEERGN